MKVLVGLVLSEAVGENLFQASLLGLKVAVFTSHGSPVCMSLCPNFPFL